MALSDEQERFLLERILKVRDLGISSVTLYSLLIRGDVESNGVTPKDIDAFLTQSIRRCLVERKETRNGVCWMPGRILANYINRAPNCAMPAV
ncbi:MAG: hypothetical protein UU77_C0040G0007 [candidate division WWE3 bacterium GW2011_GWC1_41_7]|uniref:Uncharacterized protein n=3 Tax=Katanobacteria TaxID=422282 RepID=A0A0G0X3V8_UNCKA|nr:MAG: hypothetical protein UU72_C0030G0006 [candidate division WWE3 bacterium GW2011_GWB1_41_6]KKS19724.1 MAG: hypothetical protein UU77_C0040G0007 [candidate division WWE3 bacterium GW2011_GWC1_41_7]OGC56663.1 MAG: hypothetical protein A2976_04870 [candidate division WWE3 bacterium RIFCSPLOWO2_01_FULL_41_9]